MYYGIAALILIVLAGVYLFMRQKNGPIPLSGDLEKTLDQFVKEMTEQNELLLQAVSESEQKWQKKVEQLELRIKELEQAFNDGKQGSLSSEKAIPRQSHETAAEPQSQEDALALKKRYQRIFELHQNGLTIDEIAKAVGSGKGEVQFILQLAKME
ncbi:MAG: hypothetical protein H0Z33_03750 [Bacillaceae bacterium]|nr:hypothetical protein [Bacillaceae bacterium]